MITVLCGVISNSEGSIFIARRKPGKSMDGKCEFVSATYELTDHDKYEWVPHVLKEYDLAAADIPFLDLI